MKRRLLVSKAAEADLLEIWFLGRRLTARRGSGARTYRFCSRIAPVGQLRSQAMSRVHS